MFVEKCVPDSAGIDSLVYQKRAGKDENLMKVQHFYSIDSSLETYIFPVRGSGFVAAVT